MIGTTVGAVVPVVPQRPASPAALGPPSGAPVRRVVHHTGAPTHDGKAATSGAVQSAYPGGLGSEVTEAAARRSPAATAELTAVSGTVSPPEGGPWRTATMPT